MRLLAVALVAGAMSACQAPAPKPETSPPLELIGVGALNVPDGCRAAGSVIVDFTVFEDGRTGGIQPASAPSCLREALTAWVASFRYAPVPSQTRSSFEWLMVEARKGS